MFHKKKAAAGDQPEKKPLALKTEHKILLASAAVFVMLLFLALYTSSAAASVNIVFIGIIVLTGPYSAYKFLQFRKLRAYEREFPNFLRDVSDAQRAGLTLVQAIKAVSKAEYGILTNEVRKMEKQLSWNVPLEKVMAKFSQRMSDSRLIVRSIMILEQANKSGGDIEDTMEELASNIESLREVQEEKSALLNQHVIMMYAIFFIFLGITIALIRFLVPILQTQGLSTGFASVGFSANPCTACVTSTDPACFGCTAFSTLASAFDLGPPQDPSSYYKALFLTMILVQGFFTGLIAGQISSDSLVAGLKHSLIMLFSGFSIFMLVTRLGIV